jgi:ABC-2 type transport system permease protein
MAVDPATGSRVPEMADPGAGLFVRMKLRLIRNGLRSGGRRLGMFIFGSVFGLFLAASGLLTLSIPGLAEDQRAAEVMFPLVGGAVTLGWIIFPLLFFGVDESLDPARFALLPVRRRALIRGLFAAALIGVPPLATLVALLGSVVAALLLGGLLAGVAQLLGVLVGLLVCVALSRSVTSALATALRGRRSREVATVVIALSAGLLGPLQFAVSGLIRRTDGRGLAGLADVLTWTPFGAAFSLGPDVAAGRYGAAAVKLGLVVALIALLLWWWSVTLERAMLGAATSSAPRRRTGGGSTPVTQLLPRCLPRSAFGALAAREIRYWWRDARRRAGIITFTVVGFFLPILTVSGSGGSLPLAGVTLVFVAAVVAISLANQFGYDHSAYAAHLVIGVPGRVELAARTAGFSAYAMPVLILIASVVSIVAGRPAGAPVLIAMVLAGYGTALAVVLPISVLAAFPIPQTSSPFAMSSGSGAAKGLLTFVAMLGTVVVTVPLHLGWLLPGGAWLWAGPVIALGFGAAVFWLSLRVTAPVLDRRAPELLTVVSTPV